VDYDQDMMKGFNNFCLPLPSIPLLKCSQQDETVLVAAYGVVKNESSKLCDMENHKKTCAECITSYNT
jgi:hypothetical protein